ncbi:hypothetical protein JCM10908_007289 [Rhodotorula pacifica]|uniref:uncharacterized protein n=1 Tax=Rhodotorula pacifica TaxID=1495444 RepID=UPI00316F7BC2
MAHSRDSWRSAQSSQGPSNSKWASSSAQPPSRTGTATQSGAPTLAWRTAAHSKRGENQADAAQISRQGLRRARHDIGRTPDQFELLLSPSRGDDTLQDDNSSLRNPKVQEQFRDHIAQKLHKWALAAPRIRASRQEELGTILLDFRKLREGVTSARRVDAFACEVYEASVLLALANGNEPQLSSSLPHLVTSLYPAFLLANQSYSSPEDDDVSTRMGELSLSSAAAPDPGAAAADPAHRAFFVTLHLLHSSLLPAESAPRLGATESSASPPPSGFLPAFEAAVAANRLSAPSSFSAAVPPATAASAIPYSTHPDPHLAFLLRLRLALSTKAYSTLSSSLLCLSSLPPLPPRISSHLDGLHFSSSSSGFRPLAAMLRKFVPRLRENRIWPVVKRAYRFPPDRTEWLGSVLLFELEVEFEVEQLELEEKEGDGKGEGRPNEAPDRKVKEDWNEEDEDHAGKEEEDARQARRDRIRSEAARRAAIWVAERTKK